MDWSSLAGQFAQIGLPAIGTLLGGPLGGTIGGIVGKSIAVALNVPATPEAVSTAIAQNPDGAAKALAEIEAETKRNDAFLADIANARQMQLGLVQAAPASISSRMPSIVTLLIFAAWIILTGALYFVQGEIPERVYQLLSQAYGAANLALGTAIAFWLGSSRSSQQKDTQLTAALTTIAKR